MSAPDSLATFAASLRNAGGLTQKALAQASSASFGVVQKIERGERVRLATLEKIYRDTLRVSDLDWKKMIALWLKSILGGEISLEQLSETLGAERLAEGSSLYGTLSRIERALRELSGEEQETLATFAEQITHRRQWINWMRGMVNDWAERDTERLPVAEPEAPRRPVKYSVEKRKAARPAKRKAAAR